jgi:hypothetical protein
MTTFLFVVNTVLMVLNVGSLALSLFFEARVRRSRRILAESPSRIYGRGYPEEGVPYYPAGGGSK